MPWEIEQKNKKIKLLEKKLFSYNKGITKFVLVYPNTYYVGMSNLGFQTVFHMLSSNPQINCQRAFLPKKEEINHAKNVYSLEETIPLQDFNILGFSISYELDFLNTAKILNLSKIPLEAKKRDESFPLIVAGGAAVTINPEPIAEFIDAFIIGESELVLPKFIEAYVGNAGRDKTAFLKNLSKIDGIYIPSFYDFKYNKEKITTIEKNFSQLPSKIKKQTPESLDFNTHSVLLTPQTEFSNTFLVEISRGCPHNCKFCIVKQCYSPYRWRKYSVLKEAEEIASKNTSKVGFISTDMASHPESDEILDETIKRKLKISFSSMRADKVTDKMLYALKESDQDTLTFAPEVGSENKRWLLGKTIKDKDIFNSLLRAEKLKIKNIRFYFMTGLPIKQDEAGELVKFMNAILSLNNKKLSSFLNFTLSLNQFIPKPHTLFEREQQAPLKEIEFTINKIRADLKNKKNIKISCESPKKSYLAGILSRGDRRISSLINKCHSNSSPQNLEKELNLLNLKAEWFLQRFADDRILPWKLI